MGWEVRKAITVTVVWIKYAKIKMIQFIKEDRDFLWYLCSGGNGNEGEYIEL